MITVQAIRYTSDPVGWHRLALALGLRAAAEPTPEWAEFDGDGVLAIHAATSSTPAGADELHLLVDDLDAVITAGVRAGCDMDRASMADVGEVVTITAASGQRITASVGARPTSGVPRVQPIWYQADGAAVRDLFRALGLRPRIASDSGTWADFVADGGGGAAFHRDEHTTVRLSLEYAGDLEVLRTALADAGYDAVVVDEAYNRTLLVPTPDGDRLWINGVQEDLYGYHRED